MDLSILMPFVPRRPEQILPFAGLVRFTRAARLWQGHCAYVDAHQQFAFAAGAGMRVPVGLGVTLMPQRHPLDAAMQVRSLAATVGQPVVGGFGPGGRSFQAAVLGRPYPSPLGACRQYLDTLRGLLQGRRVTCDGPAFRCDAALPPLQTPPIELGLGVLRPGMAALAGEVADVAICWLTPAGYIRDVIAPAVARGADAVRRERPRIVAMIPVARTRRDRGAAEIALAGNAAHLRAPHYADMLRRAGVGVTGADLLADAQAAVAGGAFLTGDVGRIAEQIALFDKAGVDELVLNVTGIATLYGPEAALDELTRLLAALP